MYWMLHLFCSLVFSATGAITLDQEADITGDYLRFNIAPGESGVIQEFGPAGVPLNLAGGDGLLQEGFGVGSYYIPNRRLNEKLEALHDLVDRPVLRYSYTCDGPNIRGLEVERRMELPPGEASLRVTWRIRNTGTERQWVAPWLRNEVGPGGSITRDARLDVPAFEGLLRADRNAYYAAARNWIAVTDPIEKVSLCAVFNADDLHSFLTLWEPEETKRGFQAAFVPRMLDSGQSFETVYRINVARGLSHIDFATDELMAQLDYEAGKLVLLIAAFRPMKDLQIHARVADANGEVWRLAAKKFDIEPGRLVRCTYDWTAPVNGTYEFLAQIRQLSQPLLLGKDTASPHGGIDTQFTVGSVKPLDCPPGDRDCMPFPAWTDAPFLLERGARTFGRELAASGPVALWFEHSLEKVFREDRIEPNGRINPVHRLALARNERESFQVVLRPSEGNDIRQVRFQKHDLALRGGEARIPASDIEISNVAYQAVRIPSNFEGPTGVWPDALPQHTPFDAPGGLNTPVWITVYARPGLPAGIYQGMLEVSAAGLDPIELWIEARVFDFDLPAVPALKTDFGFTPETAMRGARNASPAALARAYHANALAHRVTLRTLAQFPEARGDYGAALDEFARQAEEDLKQGVSTFSVPATLLETPVLLEQANAFVKRHGLEERVFVHLADDPVEPAWPRLLETMQRWKNTAPDIPIMVTSAGLKPFIPEVLDLWAVHAQVFDTSNNKTILEHVAAGNEVWWFVNYAPPRPYGNFLVDFASIEHRILFWQAWALGLRGMHYWNINYCEPKQDPWRDLLDITPVNGDGFLVYPGPDGPVNSIRWECIRDGIEDYDYLALFLAGRRRILASGGQEALLQKAARVNDLSEVVPSLVTFTRDPEVLLKKRLELGEIIEEFQRTAPR